MRNNSNGYRIGYTGYNPVADHPWPEGTAVMHVESMRRRSQAGNARTSISISESEESMSMTQSEFEALILEAIVDEGDLTTLGAENGVEIDGHGPSEGNARPLEGWFTKDGRRSYFAATITVTLEEFSPDYGYDEDDEDDESEEDADV